LKLLNSVACTELGWTNPNPRGEYVMPESDVFRLIVKSEKPEAERFERWLYEEVLPSIRKTGSYSTHQPTEQTTHLKSTVIKVAFADCLEIARMCGIEGNMALLSADNGVKQLTGQSALYLVNATHLHADPLGKVYTPTELGSLMDPPIKAQKMNLLLEAAGLQKKELGAWTPTDNAQGLCEWADTGKRYSGGTPIKQLRWFKTVLDHLEPDYEELVA